MLGFIWILFLDVLILVINFHRKWDVQGSRKVLLCCFSPYKRFGFIQLKLNGWLISDLKNVTNILMIKGWKFGSTYWDSRKFHCYLNLHVCKTFSCIKQRTDQRTFLMYWNDCGIIFIRGDQCLWVAKFFLVHGDIISLVERSV